MLELSVPKIYRIIDTSNQKSQEVNNFLLKCFEKFGKEASSLLAFCYLDKSNIDFFESIFYRFSNVLDFSFIDKTIFETMLAILKETKDTIKQKDEKIEDFQNTQKKLKETIKQKDELIDELIKDQNKLKEQISQLKEEIGILQSLQKNFIDTIDQKEKEINIIKNVQKEEIEKEENKLRQKIQENEHLKEEIKKIQSQNNEKIKLQENLLSEKDNIIRQKLKEVNELKAQIDQICIKDEILEFYHKENAEFNGIFKYLTEKTGGIVSENGTITITSSSVHNNNRGYMPQNLVNFASEDKYFYAKSDDTYFWVCFDFKNMEVELSSYTIKSNNWGINIGHIKTWVIEISDDGSKWQQIDHHENDSSLNNALVISSFNVQKKKFSRYFRFRHTGKYWGGSGAGFNSIEFYGRIIIHLSK